MISNPISVGLFPDLERLGVVSKWLPPNILISSQMMMKFDRVNYG